MSQKISDSFGIGFLCHVFLTLCVSACQSSFPNDPVLKMRDSFLWKVERNDKINYLFGTLHYYPDACDNLNAIVMKKLHEQKILLVEDEGIANMRTEKLSPNMVDGCTLREARAKKLLVRGMETHLESLTAISKVKLPEEADEKYLQKETIELVGCYQKTDLRCIEEIIFRGSMRNAYDNLVRMRNEKWLDVMIPYFERGETFVAIGVGHFTGPSALQEMLVGKGFRVSLLTTKPGLF